MIVKGGSMRRKDREMDKNFTYAIIDNSNYGTIALNDIDETYSLPLSVVRDEDVLYFHSAVEGRKINILESEPNISVSFVGRVAVPDLFSKEQIDNLVDEGRINDILSKVYTTEFESTIIFGKVNEIKVDSEKIHALKLICEKYTPDKMECFDLAIAKSLSKLKIFAIKIERITGKRKKFDIKGNELKYMAD